MGSILVSGRRPRLPLDSFPFQNPYNPNVESAVTHYCGYAYIKSARKSCRSRPLAEGPERSEGGRDTPRKSKGVTKNKKFRNSNPFRCNRKRYNHLKAIMDISPPILSDRNIPDRNGSIIIPYSLIMTYIYATLFDFKLS